MLTCAARNARGGAAWARKHRPRVRKGAMPVIGIDHVQLAMPAGAEEAARAFYRDVLGLAEEPKPAHLAARGGCWFGSGPVRIHLGVDKDFRAATKAHPGLIVKDLDDIAQRCRERGFRVIDDEPLKGWHRVYVADPFGNRIELMERAGQSPPV
jgi:catechol 2,3-dioxygenase-like lactoylglutathione lyase family enzyme